MDREIDAPLVRLSGNLQVAAPLACRSTKVSCWRETPFEEVCCAGLTAFRSLSLGATLSRSSDDADGASEESWNVRAQETLGTRVSVPCPGMKQVLSRRERGRSFLNDRQAVLDRKQGLLHVLEDTENEADSPGQVINPLADLIDSPVGGPNRRERGDGDGDHDGQGDLEDGLGEVQSHGYIVTGRAGRMCLLMQIVTC